MKDYLMKSLFIVSCFVFTASSASALTCTTLTKSLSKGSENNEVLKLQQFLFDGGYLLVNPNGYFGENTKKAAFAFQKAQKINGVGAVGQITRAKIKEITCSANSSTFEKKVSNESTASSSEKKVPVVVQEKSVVVTIEEVPTIYVKTLIPENISQKEAILVGRGGVEGEKHWFEWGTTTEMRNVTQSVASTSYTYKITQLLPSTAYYFRAVTSIATSTGRKGEVAYGDMRYFTTPSAEVVKAPVPTVSISSTGIAVNANGSARVKWTSANVTTCSFTGGEQGGNWNKSGSLSGEYITNPMTQPAIFYISCKNNLEYTVTGSVTVPKLVN